MSNPVTITAPEGVPFIDIEREFDAPVEALFRAHSDPELFTKWLGPRGYEMELAEFDFSTGGRYRYIHRTNDREFAFHGVFHVVRENEFVIQTFEYEDWPDVVSLESMTFERLDGNRSRLKGHSVYPTVEGRDGMVQSGMERGVVEGYEQLDEVLASISTPANN
jgi:uncharacterized protein YndB with AHSA1/START domain